jgi:hypothetical protein
MSRVCMRDEVTAQVRLRQQQEGQTMKQTWTTSLAAAAVSAMALVDIASTAGAQGHSHG